ncbi:proprotein convertase subtilisin/kexin type 5-like [Acanthaster planci]|uniref:Proprotein convertase subtilisin/kexin type 5-like n=1 Tax=Acanthaster planci TaxID=133434 RepID=A0A8B7ZT10_ACAPL|nr:proprotein convertase subtilisin/kexin type 5-like [Acanthaster planci]
MQENSQCPEQQYRALQSDGRPVCRDCTPHCKRCLGPREDECLICAADYRLANGHCRQNCNTGQFHKDGVCMACHPSCGSCTGPSPYECTSCPDGLVHTVSGADKGECSVGCPQGTFRHGSQCRACHDTCQSCDGEGEERCLSCQSTFFLTGNQRCVPTCGDGTYQYRSDVGGGDEALSGMECRPCHSSCATCYGPLETECTACHNSMYRLEHTCVGHCGTGYWPGPQNVCQPCHFDCMSCWGNRQDQCISCASGKKLLAERCVDECPASHYLSLDFGAVCEPCHVRCKTCYDMGPFNCLSCKDGYELDNSVCYSRCDLGMYFINHTQECAPCDKACRECYGPTDKQCIACYSGKSLMKVDDKRFTCLVCCQQGQDPDRDNCCKCNKDQQCMPSQGNQGNSGADQPADRPGLNHGAIIFICLLILAVFGLFFGLLQARSRKKLCWRDNYETLPTFYNNSKGEEPKITLRQNALPSSDDEDFFDDTDEDL